MEKISEDHYKLTQHKIDVLEKEEERVAHLEEKPYPLYPSKAGLKPNNIADAISRLVSLESRFYFNKKISLKYPNI